MQKILLILAFLFASAASAETMPSINQFVLDKPFDAPNMKFFDDQGNIHNLSDYKGKVVLLNFWATWCNPCVHEMPTIAALAKAMADKDIVILPVAVDDKGVPAVQAFFKEQGIDGLGIYVDTKGKAFKDFKLQGLPTTMIIDRKGSVVAQVEGEIDWNSPEAHKYLLGVGAR